MVVTGGQGSFSESSLELRTKDNKGYRYRAGSGLQREAAGTCKCPCGRTEHDSSWNMRGSEDGINRSTRRQMKTKSGEAGGEQEV